jgi:hypothetical protein
MTFAPGSLMHPSASPKEVIVFDHVCSACGKRQLVFASRVRSIVNTAAGIQVTHICWCGAPQTWLTGKAATKRSDAPLSV